MSCNGCRVLRKGCTEDCMLRQCLQWLENPQAQANATVFVSKFFGRAGLMSFLSSVPQFQRPTLFQSLLFEAVGRAVNPVGGAVGLLWTGNWHVCQSAVETVLSGGALHPMPGYAIGVPVVPPISSDDVPGSAVNRCKPRDAAKHLIGKSKPLKMKTDDPRDDVAELGPTSRNYSDSRFATETTTSSDGLESCGSKGLQRKLLRLFV